MAPHKTKPYMEIFDLQLVPLDSKTLFKSSTLKLPSFSTTRSQKLDEFSVPKPARKPRWLLDADSWAWEIFGCTSSIICMVAVILILSHFDGHLMPIIIFDFQLGSVLSLFSTLIKAGISVPLSSGISQTMWLKLRQEQRPVRDMYLYDNASRGVLGGLILLWYRRARSVSTLSWFFA